MRLWWNGIHNGLKIRRRKLEGSNPSSRTKVENIRCCRIFSTFIMFCFVATVEMYYVT